MKKTFLLTTTVAALGFSIAPAIAEDTAASDKASTEAPAENMTTVFVVKFKGKG